MVEQRKMEKIWIQKMSDTSKCHELKGKVKKVIKQAKNESCRQSGGVFNSIYSYILRETKINMKERSKFGVNIINKNLIFKYGEGVKYMTANNKVNQLVQKNQKRQ